MGDLLMRVVVKGGGFEVSKRFDVLGSSER